MHHDVREGDIVVYTIGQNLDSQIPCLCFALDLSRLIDADTHFIVDLSGIDGICSEAFETLQKFREAVGQLRSGVSIVMGADPRRWTRNSWMAVLRLGGSGIPRFTTLEDAKASLVVAAS